MSRSDIGSTIRSGRRTFLRGAGAAGLGLTSVLAGCTGGGDGGSTDGGENGDGGSSNTIRLGFSPGQMNNLLLYYLQEETNTLANRVEESGFELDLERTFDSPTLYASGQIDMMTAAPVELMLMGQEQDVRSVWFGTPNLMSVCFHTKAGSQYDPRDTGGARESFQLLAENNGTFASAGWSAGTLPFQKMLYESWDLLYSEEESSFNVQPTGIETLGAVLVNDRADISSVSPQFPGALQYIIPEVEIMEVYNCIDQEVLSDVGLDSGPSFGVYAARQEAWEQKEEGFVAIYEAFSEALGWLDENKEQIRERNDLTELMDMDDRDQAQWRFDWGIGGDLTENWGSEYERWENPGEMRADPAITDDLLEADEQFINRAVEEDMAPEDPWQYLQVEQLG